MWSNKLLKKVIYNRSSRNLHYSIVKFSKWIKFSQGHARKQDKILRTEMFVQEDFKIYELPIIIQKTSNLKSIIENDKRVNKILGDACISTPLSKRQEEIGNDSKSSTVLLFASELEFLKNLEIEQIIKEIENSAPANNINSLLENVIYTEINSKVALESLKKIIDVERKYRKLKRPTKFVINRHMVVKQLVELIINTQDSRIILEALLILLKDKYDSPNSMYKDLIVNEALIRSTNGEFDIKQLISITRILYAFKDFKHREAIDYLWTGFVIKQEDITVNDLVPLFKLLARLKQSRNRVQILLEKKLIQNYHKLSVSQVTDIVNVFQSDLYSTVVFKCATKWTRMHLTSISKYDLLEFIESLSSAKYVNSTIEKAIEKILMSKNMRSNDHSLVAAVAVYCSTVHLRNACILNIVVKYLEKHAKSLPLPSFVEMISTIGELNFEPQNKEKFWKILENTIDKKFLDLQIDEILCILVSCAYINRYFPKYTDKILSPLFMEKLHLYNDSNTVKFLRNQLCLLDTAMSIECKMYKGPLLFYSSQISPAFVDLRIMRIVNKIHSQLVKLAGDEEKLSKHVTLSKLSTAELYTLDALIHKNLKVDPALELDLIKEKNENTAVLILLPDYYCWNSTKLVGQQAMKIRHLRKLGFRVMLLDFQILWKLQKQHDESTKYLNHAFKMAHQAL